MRYIQKLFLLFLFISGPLSAETLKDLQSRLLRDNPAIAAARLKYLAATKGPIQEGTLPDPRVSFTDFGVGHPFSNLNGSDFAYRATGFSQDLPFPGKLSLRSKISKQQVLSGEQEYRFIAVELLSELKSHTSEYQYLSAAITAAEKSRDLLNQLTEITEMRYRVGEGLQQDVLRTQIERSILEERLVLLRKDLLNERASINALLNQDPSTGFSIEGEIKRSGELPPLQELVAKLQTSPQYVQESITEQTRTLELNLAKKELYPDFTASFQWQKTGSEFPDYYMTSIEARIPLFYWKRQQPAIAQADLNLQASRKAKEASLRKLETELTNAYESASANDNLLKLYQEGIIPQTRISMQSSLSAYQVGKLDFISVLNTATTLLNYETETIRRLADREKAVADLERLTGSFIEPARVDLQMELNHE